MCDACSCAAFVANNWNTEDQQCKSCFHLKARHRTVRARRMSDEGSPLYQDQPPPPTPPRSPYSTRGRPPAATTSSPLLTIQDSANKLSRRPIPVRPQKGASRTFLSTSTPAVNNGNGRGAAPRSPVGRPPVAKNADGPSSNKAKSPPTKPRLEREIGKKELRPKSAYSEQKAQVNTQKPLNRRAISNYSPSAIARRPHPKVPPRSSKEYPPVASPVSRRRAPSIPLEAPPRQAPIGSSPLVNEREEELSEEEKRSNRRAKIVTELLMTEESYVKNLTQLLEVYRTPLLEESILNSDASELIFGNAVAIERLHRELLDKLQRFIREVPHASEACVSSAFSDILPFLRLYTSYVNTFDDGINAITKQVEENRRFKEFLDMQAREGRLKLDALRVEPVQRIPRYVLLLADLVKYTPEEHPDYQELKKVEAEVQKIGYNMNEGKRENENRVRIEGLSRQLKGNRRAMRDSFKFGDENRVKHKWIIAKLNKPTFCGYCDKLLIPSILGSDRKKYMECSVCGVVCHMDDHRALPTNCGTNETLLKPGRWYIKEGRIRHTKIQLNRVKHQKGGNEHEGIAILFNDSLVITYPNDAGVPDVIDSMIRWTSRTTGRNMAMADSTNTSFTITSPREAEVHTIVTASMEEKEEWMNAINEQTTKWNKLHNQKEQNKESDSAAGPTLGVGNRRLVDKKRSETGRRMRFAITSTVPVKNTGQKSFIAYVVDITDTENNTRTVLKRYRDFHNLHSKLREHYPSKELPKMPGKRILGDNLDPMFIQRRCRRLEDYLNQVSFNKEMMALPAMQYFIDTSLGESKSDNLKKRKSANDSPSVKVNKTEDGGDGTSTEELTSSPTTPKKPVFVGNEESDEDYSSDDDEEKDIDRGTVTSFQSKLSALSFTTTIEKELGLDAEAEKVVLDDSNVDDCASYPRARALWAYNDDSRDDVVVLDKGEIVTVIEQSNDQWWFVQRDNGDEGWAPRMYLRMQ